MRNKDWGQVREHKGGRTSAGPGGGGPILNCIINICVSGPSTSLYSPSRVGKVGVRVMPQCSDVGSGCRVRRCRVTVSIRMAG